MVIRDVIKTGNGERGTRNEKEGALNREWDSWNECTAVTRLRIPNGGQRKGNKRKCYGCKREFLSAVPHTTGRFLLEHTPTGIRIDKT